MVSNVLLALAGFSQKEEPPVLVPVLRKPCLSSLGYRHVHAEGASPSCAKGLLIPGSCAQTETSGHVGLPEMN